MPMLIHNDMRATASPRPGDAACSVICQSVAVFVYFEKLGSRAD